MEDEAIIESLTRRSEEALAALDARYGSAGRRLAEGMTGDREDAEEIVSDALLACWNRIPPERPRHLRAYLLKIVRNLSLERRRSASAKKRGGGNLDAALEELEDCLPGGDDPEEAVLAMELKETIEAFLAGLSDNDRILFLRRYWFADSYRDIAELTGLSEKNVSVRLARIRRRLGKFLDERGAL